MANILANMATQLAALMRHPAAEGLLWTITSSAVVIVTIYGSQRLGQQHTIEQPLPVVDNEPENLIEANILVPPVPPAPNLPIPSIWGHPNSVSYTPAEPWNQALSCHFASHHRNIDPNSVLLVLLSLIFSLCALCWLLCKCCYRTAIVPDADDGSSPGLVRKSDLSKVKCDAIIQTEATSRPHGPAQKQPPSRSDLPSREVAALTQYVKNLKALMSRQEEESVARISELEAELQCSQSNADATNLNLVARISELETELRSSQSHADALQSNLTTRTSELEAELESSQSHADALHSKLTTRTSELEVELQKSQSHAEATHSKLAARTRELEAELQKSQSHTATLQSQLEEGQKARQCECATSKTTTNKLNSGPNDAPSTAPEAFVQPQVDQADTSAAPTGLPSSTNNIIRPIAEANANDMAKSQRITKPRNIDTSLAGSTNINNSPKTDGIRQSTYASPLQATPVTPRARDWKCPKCHVKFPATVKQLEHTRACEAWHQKYVYKEASGLHTDIGYPPDWLQALLPHPTPKTTAWMHVRMRLQQRDPALVGPVSGPRPSLPVTTPGLVRMTAGMPLRPTVSSFTPKSLPVAEPESEREQRGLTASSQPTSDEIPSKELILRSTTDNGTTTSTERVVTLKAYDELIVGKNELEDILTGGDDQNDDNREDHQRRRSGLPSPRITSQESSVSREIVTDRGLALGLDSIAPQGDTGASLSEFSFSEQATADPLVIVASSDNDDVDSLYAEPSPRRVPRPAAAPIDAPSALVSEENGAEPSMEGTEERNAEEDEVEKMSKNSPLQELENFGRVEGSTDTNDIAIYENVNKIEEPFNWADNLDADGEHPTLTLPREYSSAGLPLDIPSSKAVLEKQTTDSESTDASEGPEGAELTDIPPSNSKHSLSTQTATVHETEDAKDQHRERGSAEILGKSVQARTKSTTSQSGSQRTGSDDKKQDTGSESTSVRSNTTDSRETTLPSSNTAANINEQVGTTAAGSLPGLSARFNPSIMPSHIPGFGTRLQDKNNRKVSELPADLDLTSFPAKEPNRSALSTPTMKRNNTKTAGGLSNSRHANEDSRRSTPQQKAPTQANTAPIKSLQHSNASTPQGSKTCKFCGATFTDTQTFKFLRNHATTCRKWNQIHASNSYIVRRNNGSLEIKYPPGWSHSLTQRPAVDPQWLVTAKDAISEHNKTS